MLKVNTVYGLVTASGAVSGTALVTRPRDGFRHLFLVTLSAAGIVWVEAAVDPGVSPIRWVPVSATVTVSGEIPLEGNVTNLRVAWSGNAGLVTVDLLQSALIPDVY